MKTLALLTLAFVTSTLSAQASVRENGGMRSPEGVEIRFISFGAGPDSESKREIDAMIDKAKFTRTATLYTERDWGMEGEVTICVELKDFNKVNAFYRSAKEIIGQGNKLVTAMLVQDCSGGTDINPIE